MTAPDPARNSWPTPPAPHRPCCDSDGCARGISRRTFVRLSGTGLLTLGAGNALPAVAGPFPSPAGNSDHFVPVDKQLRDDWVQALFAKGERTWFSGDDLKTIGMPVGGICAGQVYLTGDGRLVYWDIFNQNVNTGYGQVNYRVGREPTQVVVRGGEFAAAPVIEQGFALRATVGGQTHVRALDRRGFPDVRFCGEYPVGYVQYLTPDFPLEVSLEAFSPFIPLNADDSALPATVLQYTLRNTSAETVDVTLAGWLENAVLHYGRERFAGQARRTNSIRAGANLTMLHSGLQAVEVPPQPVREPIVLADFEGDDYGRWTVEGEAFGNAPAHGTLPNQQPVSGFRGRGLVNSYVGGNDQKRGRLVSPPFTIDRAYLSMLVGGGGHGDKTCVRLVVDGRPVRTVSGTDNEVLRPHNWNVKELAGKQARLEIIDGESGPWGHINVDQIELRDTPLLDGVAELHLQPDYGSMALAVVGSENVISSASLPPGALPEVLFVEGGLATDVQTARPLDERLRGAVGRRLVLAPGQQTTVTFVVAWCMPNMYAGPRRVGNHYARRFEDSGAIAAYVADNLERLTRDTRLWHDTYYDSSLPYWLLDRLHSTVANLATTTCQWWNDGRFWAWEGCGCCHGTCGHVWNYEHALARLFPTLERSVRERQDFAAGVGFIPETGEIRFRGEDWGIWAGDAQGGYLLKAYREHRMSSDDRFLKSYWPQIKRAVEFLIAQDGNNDGLIEGRQHQTYDQDYYGANTMVGSLYLGALRAAEELAREMGDTAFAQRCRDIFAVGSRNSVARLFNGEYFIQDVDLQKYPDWQYADGCLADQLFGQGWAHQVGLGYLYPRDTVLKALESIWKYCWAPDVGPQNKQHEPERWFAYPGEAGLFTCTWPKSRHLGAKSTRYRDEIWTGIEYQVAGHMAFEGMLTEALAICRAVHERYHPRKHNPFNEIECGDHYARAMASWGVLVTLAGFDYHGPRRHIGFAPRLTPEEFRAVFTTAEGWGTIQQRRAEGRQTNAVDVKWGQLVLETCTLSLPAGAQPKNVAVNGGPQDFTVERQGDGITVRFASTLTVPAGQQLEIICDL